MLAVLDKSAPLSQRARVVRICEEAGFRVQVSDTGTEHLIGVIGPGAERLADQIRTLPGVREVRPVAPPYPRVAPKRGSAPGALHQHWEQRCYQKRQKGDNGC